MHEFVRDVFLIMVSIVKSSKMCKVNLDSKEKEEYKKKMLDMIKWYKDYWCEQHR